MSSTGVVLGRPILGDGVGDGGERNQTMKEFKKCGDVKRITREDVDTRKQIEDSGDSQVRRGNWQNESDSWGGIKEYCRYMMRGVDYLYLRRGQHCT